MAEEHHLTESRAELEERFMLMGGFMLRAREKGCGAADCVACIALREPIPIPIPVSVLGLSAEPREDLEEAVVSIMDRFDTLVEVGGAEDCPGRQYVIDLLTRATEMGEAGS
jgi:hypothetical protein